MSFKEYFQESFESALAGEDLTHVDVAGVTEEEQFDSEIFREVNDELLTPQQLGKEIEEANRVETALSGAMECLDEVRSVPPTYLPPVISTVNEQLRDTAAVLGVGEAPQLKYDEETHELDQPSMEGALDWLKKGMSALSDSLRKLWARVAFTFRRFQDWSHGLNKRVARCYSMLPRRKNAHGNNPIKIKPTYLEKLVVETGLSNDYLGDLSVFGSALSSIYLAYTPSISELETEISNALTSAIAYGSLDSKAAAGINADTGKLVAALDAIVKTDKMYLGNVKLKFRTTKAGFPGIEFQDAKPFAGMVVRSIGQVPSLDSEKIRSILLGMQREIDQHMLGLEQILTDMDDKMSKMKTAINRVIIGENRNVMSGRTDALELGLMVANVPSHMRLSKVKIRIDTELLSVFEMLDDLHSAYFERASAIMVHIEESLMQD